MQDETPGTRRTSVSERESLRAGGTVGSADEGGYSRDDISVLSFKPCEGQVLTRCVHRLLLTG